MCLPKKGDKITRKLWVAEVTYLGNSKTFRSNDLDNNWSCTLDTKPPVEGHKNLPVYHLLQSQRGGRSADDHRHQLLHQQLQQLQHQHLQQKLAKSLHQLTYCAARTMPKYLDSSKIGTMRKSINLRQGRSRRSNPSKRLLVRLMIPNLYPKLAPSTLTPVS